MTHRFFIRAVLLCGGVLVGATPAVAQSAQRTYVDLTGSIGYSTNPGLSLSDDSASVFGRLSVNGVHSWRTERSSTSLSAYLENSYYPNRYGNKQLFDLNASSSYQASETVSVFGGVSFSGDFGGQLGTRFIGDPVIPPPATPVDPSAPPPTTAPEPVLPPPTTVVDPDLLALSGRQYRLSGNAGVSIRPNERDTWTLSAGAHRLFYPNSDRDYTTYALSGGYSRQLSERLSLGLRTSVVRADYLGNDSTTSISPQVTISALLAESWSADAAVGVTYRNRDVDGDSDDSFGLALDASVCRSLERSRFCGRVARYSQNTIAADLLTTTSAGIDYSQTIDENSSFQLSASAIRYGGRRVLDRSVTSNYFVTSAAYNRRINDRLTGGVNGSARRLTQSGPDPDTDVSASVFLRYRFGDLR
ncbi:hypothetical protein [Sphingomonas arenae]|uniref:hypothetical protein n=1 Tax=Sphingomonas arenae TaxID=2812555 RepID=UPI0019679B03|nr:hypothetical protein [Sphingomonas arenae]